MSKKIGKNKYKVSLKSSFDGANILISLFSMNQSNEKNVLSGELTLSDWEETSSKRFGNLILNDRIAAMSWV